MTIIPQCFDCIHLHRREEGMLCDAFPGGIPRDILLAEFDHGNPHDGDHGIRFEPIRPGRSDVGEYLGADLDREG